MENLVATTSSPSRTYIVVTPVNVYKVKLPEGLGNSDYVAIGYFLKYLTTNEFINLCVPYEVLKIIKEIEKLPVFKPKKVKDIGFDSGIMSNSTPYPDPED